MWEKYEQIVDVIKNKLGTKFHSETVYDKAYIKAKVREFDRVIKTNFLSNDVPKNKYALYLHCCITIDSVMRIDKKKSSASLFRRV